MLATQKEKDKKFSNEEDEKKEGNADNEDSTKPKKKSLKEMSQTKPIWTTNVDDFSTEEFCELSLPFPLCPCYSSSLFSSPLLTSPQLSSPLLTSPHLSSPQASSSSH